VNVKKKGCYRTKEKKTLSSPTGSLEEELFKKVIGEGNAVPWRGTAGGTSGRDASSNGGETRAS